ncbi:MAG: hypothetical protein FWH34_05995 [Desulfovibrionaceae bacterium]|nr:hypothetical protein [Desulfovibrionaceae bacterium]
MSDTPLTQALKGLDSLPFHMPGHKRNTALLGSASPWSMDITELSGFDNLYNPDGVLLDLMRRAAALWNSKASYISVNGSTGAILAGIRAMTRQGDKILAARNCHMSVFHAMELCGLRPVFLEPEWLPAWGIYGKITQETVDQALAGHPDAALCVVTSPTYEGVQSEIICPIPLFIDAAHGAHLPSPKADLACVSTHKTLPALTQTALLHVMSERVDIPRLERQLRIFQTSSPSYILMASIEQCVALLERERGALFAAWNRRLDEFYSHARQWKNLRLFQPGEHSLWDRSKILLHCGTGVEEFLRTHRIEPEYIRHGNALFLTSPCDSNDMMRALANALDELDARLPATEPPSYPRPPQFSSIHLMGNSQFSIEFPPGIPMPS